MVTGSTRRSRRCVETSVRNIERRDSLHYTPSDARGARALCCDDVNAERAPRVRGVKETLWGVPGVHVAHFRPMCLTARNSLRHPKSPVMSRTGPTRFDAWSSRGRRPERTLRGHPHVLGRHVVCRKGVYLVSFHACVAKRAWCNECMARTVRADVYTLHD